MFVSASGKGSIGTELISLKPLEYSEGVACLTLGCPASPCFTLSDPTGTREMRARRLGAV